MMFLQDTPWMQALALCSMFSLAAPVGVFLLLRRMTLIGDALSHGMLPGAAVSVYFFGPCAVLATICGGVFGCVLMMGAFWACRHRFLELDASFSGMYLASSALGWLVLSKDPHHLEHMIFGQLHNLSGQSFKVISLILVVSVGIMLMFFQPLVMDTFDPAFSGQKKSWLRGLFLVLIVVHFTTLFYVWGPFVSLGFVMLPSLCSRLLTSNFMKMCWGAVGISLLSSVLGLWACRIGQWAWGPGVVGVMGLFYAACLLSSRFFRPGFWKIKT